MNVKQLEQAAVQGHADGTDWSASGPIMRPTLPRWGWITLPVVSSCIGWSGWSSPGMRTASARLGIGFRGQTTSRRPTRPQTTHGGPAVMAASGRKMNHYPARAGSLDGPRRTHS